MGEGISQQNADLIIHNAVIWTAENHQQFVSAIAIDHDTLMYAGDNHSAQALAGPQTEIIDARGKFIVPGFIDCHVHFMTGGFNLSSVQLRDAKTPEEFIERIQAFLETQEEGTWILGGDWDHENWGGILPSRNWIDSISPKHPVWINRLDGHMALANSVALKLAGITEAIKVPMGGSITRDEQGRLTGIFKDNAMAVVAAKVPSRSEAQEDLALQRAMEYVAARGVTSVHHMSGYEDVFLRAHQSGNLKTRIYYVDPLPSWKDLYEKINIRGKGDKWLRFGGLKGFVDGSLGSHTAAFFEPYSDQPGDSGFFVNTNEQLNRWIDQADQHNLQVMVHAIGDRAIHTLLNIYEEIIEKNGPRDRRFRIEHAQHIGPADIPRFAQLSVLPSMQPYHAIDDGRWAEKVIGPERIKTTYAFNSLINSGARVAFGSDWFVAPPTPLMGIYAAVTRRTLDDAYPQGWVPEQKITVEQALRAYTIDAAFASFEDHIKGSIAVGKLADFLILDQNLLEISPEEIKDAQILATYVGGKKVYAR